MDIHCVRLHRDYLYEALAQDCIRHGGQEKDKQDSECFAEAYNLGCPFESENVVGVECDQIRATHWREVFEEESDAEKGEDD